MSPNEIIFVGSSPTHTMGKPPRNTVRLLTGLGVEGDAHMGETVKHRSRVRANPNQPNLRQVHLIHSELHVELAKKGFEILPGQMGENITTRGVDLLGLPQGTRLKLGETAIVEVTGLRNPCAQLNNVKKGLMAATIEKRADGEVIRKAGIMTIVIKGGDVSVGDKIEVILPPLPHEKLMPV